MSHPTQSRKAFAALVALPDEAIDLGHASLLIAREEYPDLQVGRYLQLLDEMGERVASRLRGGEGPATRIAHLNHVLFEEMQFRGNSEEYRDPRNSFLNDVLDRRLGIPISLSTVYLEVGRRAGCPLGGVAFPGHFLVRYTGREIGTDILIDPFNRGRLLTEDECRALLRAMFGDRLEFRPEFLKRAPKRDILLRMLGNLNAIYHEQRDYHMALKVQQLLLCVVPGDAAAIRDRGLIYHRLACLAQAVEDFETYLEKVPGAIDAPVLQERLRDLRRLVQVMN